MIRPPSGERWVALFLFAALLFSPPLLSIFGRHQLASIPSIYVYLFVSWGLVIALAALAVEGGPPREQPGRSESGDQSGDRCADDQRAASGEED